MAVSGPAPLGRPSVAAPAATRMARAQVQERVRVPEWVPERVQEADLLEQAPVLAQAPEQAPE